MSVANGLVLPNIITNGQLADAGPVMTDFLYLLGALNVAILDNGSGAISFAGSRLTNVGSGSLSSDAVNLAQLAAVQAAALPLTGGELSGTLTVDGVLTGKTIVVGTSPGAGSTGGLRIADAAGNPGDAYLQFTSNDQSAQYAWVRGNSDGSITISGSLDIGSAAYGSDGNIAGSAWGVPANAKGYVDAQVAAAVAGGIQVVSFAFGTSGYLRLRNASWPRDLYIQWVTVACTPSSFSSFSWPTPFPTQIFGAVPGSFQGLSFSGSLSTYFYPAPGLTGGSVIGNNGSSTNTTAFIIAIGD